jgi:hypothetical protein
MFHLVSQTEFLAPEVLFSVSETQKPPTVIQIIRSNGGGAQISVSLFKLKICGKPRTVMEKANTSGQNI